MQRLAQLSLRCAAPAALEALLPAGTRVLGSTLGQQFARQLHRSPLWCSEEAPSSSCSQQQEPQKQLPRQAIINRLLYRSRQRGFLELDLLIGMWAEKALPGLSEEGVAQLEAVLDQENPDMFKWLTGQQEPPEALAANDVFLQMRRHVKAMTDQHHSVPRSAGEANKEWVRGWTDSGRDMSEGKPPAAASS